ncbi:MAG TPA: acetylglutamate kinase [Firmicutes bacterium]|nr:acetylglutamate kinase [Bacillota bacterium]
MCNGYTQRQICFMNRIQQLWGQHVYWTRSFIISTAAGSGDLEPVTHRLLQNPKDFAQLLAPIYGEKTAGQFQELFTQHLLIAADLVNAAKNADVSKADAARKRWYANADEIAGFLSCINPCWSQATWKKMLYSHLEMTEKEAALRLQGNYTADIAIFDRIADEAMKMANYMFCGIIKQCKRENPGNRSGRTGGAASDAWLCRTPQKNKKRRGIPFGSPGFAASA